MKVWATVPLLAAAVRAANVTYDWSIGWVDKVNPDGLLERRGVGINGQFPPPIVNVNSDDYVRINFHNGFGDGRGSSLHAHGMFFNATNYYDGAPGVTQCPVPDGQMFSQDIMNSPRSPADRAAQWGTYWIHAHFGGQNVDGFRTPNIIHKAGGEVYQYDDDYTIVLADWYHREHDDLLSNEFMNSKNPGGAEPVPESGLMYIAHTPADGEATYLPGFNENVTLTFEPGKTYRLRLINMAALSMFHFWVEGHDMEVIEADGVDMQRYPTPVLSLSAAQRYSVLVRARNDTANNWSIHANLDPSMYDAVPDSLQLNLTSTLSYGTPDAPLGEGLRELETYDFFPDDQLVPVDPLPMVPPTIAHDLHVVFTTYNDGKSYASFNNITYVSPLTPAVMSMTTEPEPLVSDSRLYGPSANALVFPYGAVVELVVYNWDAGHHPFHLHGHQFQIVQKVMDATNPGPAFVEGANPNPARRDTVTIPAGGFVRLRFVIDNPGAWFFHCHIDWHLSAGLAAVIISAPELAASQLRLPSEMAEQCRMMNLPTSGNAGGIENSLTNFGALPSPPEFLHAGWTDTMIGTFVACIVSALIGMATICWYGFSTGETEEEEEEEVQELHEEERRTGQPLSSDTTADGGASLTAASAETESSALSPVSEKVM